MSNLKKNFTESTVALDKLYTSSQRNYDRFEGMLKGNNENGADRERLVDTLQMQLKKRDKEITQLRDQLDQLLTNVKASDGNLKSSMSSMTSMKVEPIKISA